MGKSYKRLIVLLSVFTIVFASLLVFVIGSVDENNPQHILNEFNSNLHAESLLIQIELDKYEEVLSSDPDDYWPLLEHIDENNNYYSFVFSGNGLFYWNTSDVYCSSLPKIHKSFLVRGSNNWYLGCYREIDSFNVFLLKPIITDYSVKNLHVQRTINSDFSSFEGINIIEYKNDKTYDIDFGSSNSYYLEINTDVQSDIGSLYLFISLTFAYLLFAVLLFEFIKYLYYDSVKRIALLLISFVLLLVILVFDWYFELSKLFIPSGIFQMNILDSPVSMVLGDLWIISLVFLVFIIYFYRACISKEKVVNSALLRIPQLVYMILAVLIPYFILAFSSTIINNYGIAESFFFLMDFSGFVFVLILIVLGLTLYLFLRILGFIISSNKINVNSLIITLVLSISFGVLISNIILLSISILLSLIIIAIEHFIGKKDQFLILHHLIFIVLISIIYSGIINYAEDSNKNIQQTNVSAFLSQSGNIEIEEFWQEFQSKLQNDTRLYSNFDSLESVEPELIIAYLIEQYLSKINQDFDFQITTCSEGDRLNLESEGLIVNCNDFFAEMKSNSLKRYNNNLYLISNEPDNIYYLGEYGFSKELTIYIEFYSFYIPSGLGYAELLVDRKDNTHDLSGYSFAKYNSNILISKFGEFEYHTTANIFDSYPDSLFFTLNGFYHYKTKTTNGDILIVSRPVERLSSQMISFSILFLLFSLFIMLLVFLLYGSKFRLLFRLNFRARLQLFFMIALSSILFTTAIIIMYYAEKNSTLTLENELNEKAHSVLIELQHKLSDHNSLEDVDNEQLEKLLQKFSLVFFSDINIYDTKGKIIASSRPQIFEEGFLSEMINPRAFEEIFVDNLLYYNCTERIGELEYFSTYIPLMLTSGEPAGIINLPYFARQKEQRRSFRLLLFTFINLFVILGIIGTIIAIFYSRLLTKPLTELQRNIANIRIDMKNAKIEWNSEDEIGQLISEYNRMVDKLEASADILKRSEREIAWREVARQIAHEIKNPLTPMKLNIQYLEKSYGENDDKFGEKLKDISLTLIQQIETLDKVAEMFSDMAKSNLKNFTEINLLAAIKISTKLLDNTNNITFEIINESDQTDFLIKGINKDITQIFNNLLKNSVEAIGNSENGRVIIKVSSGEAFYEVKVIDNGNGIPANRKDMIFTPYFTTRSKGTGLGLAIVKTIITDMGGNIKLESTDKNGTIFLLKFLKIN